VRLARVVNNSKVCGEQQGLYSNKDIAFHGWQTMKEN